MARPVLSLVLPIYNEEEVIPELNTQLQAFLARLGLDTEVLFVDDGSKDRSLQMLRGIAAADPRYRVLSFSRNFGHQTAITAGLDYARGHAVVVMDADLQDPPEVVLEMVQKWREGFDVVYGQRATRVGESAFKLLTAKIFYRLFAAMIPIEVPLDTGDFRLMSRRVVVALRALRESHRFVRGLVSWIGFKQTAVLYDRPARAAGETKYPLRKMVRFAIDGITSFSVVPLRAATYLGLLFACFGLVYMLWALFVHFALHDTVAGWTAEIVVITLLSSVQLVMIGILGEYIGRIYEQIKQRPLYVVGERMNLGERDDDHVEDAPPPAAIVPRAAVAPAGGTLVGMPGPAQAAGALPGAAHFPPLETLPIPQVAPIPPLGSPSSGRVASASAPPPATTPMSKPPVAPSSPSKPPTAPMASPAHSPAPPRVVPPTLASPTAPHVAPAGASRTAPMAALRPVTAEAPTVPNPNDTDAFAFSSSDAPTAAHPGPPVQPTSAAPTVPNVISEPPPSEPTAVNPSPNIPPEAHLPSRPMGPKSSIPPPLPSKRKRERDDNQ